MARPEKFMMKIAAFTAAWLAYGPAMASTFLGELPVGYSDNLFQLGGGSSYLELNINAIGGRDPLICPSCYSSYTDNFTVNLFNQTGTLLSTANETNYFYYSMYNNSKGIGAGPVGVAIPNGATTVEIVSRLSIAGMIGADGLPLNFGSLFMSAEGPIAAATPIPATLPLLATGLAALGLLGWRSKAMRSSYAI
jgi:hypothetical protein